MTWIIVTLVMIAWNIAAAGWFMKKQREVLKARREIDATLLEAQEIRTHALAIHARALATSSRLIAEERERCAEMAGTWPILEGTESWQYPAQIAIAIKEGCPLPSSGKVRAWWDARRDRMTHVSKLLNGSEPCPHLVVYHYKCVICGALVNRVDEPPMPFEQDTMNHEEPPK